MERSEAHDRSSAAGQVIIFVFGSNEAGVHGAGAAADAVKYYGGEYGKGYGFQGHAVSTELYERESDGVEIKFGSFAIPTKDRSIKTLPLSAINRYVLNFINLAENNPDDEFQVTRIGCGLAGYTDEDIAPMFQEVPSNVHLPLGWDALITGD